MDIQSYIASGKLELFLLGELTDRERDEVLALAKIHPEIRQELDELDKAFFAFDELTAKTPPPRMKERLFASLDAELKDKRTIEPRIVQGHVDQDEAKVVTITTWKTYAVAASLIAVLASAVAIYFANKFYERDQQFLSLLQEQEVMADNLNQAKFEYERKDSQIEKLIAGNFKRIPLKAGGFQIQQDAEVEVLWDQQAQEVFVAVNNLNSLSEEFDYQLWAIGSDGPIGIGLVNTGEKFTMQQMEAVAEAGVFAITIEPKGGSQSPNLDKLVVIGNVS